MLQQQRAVERMREMSGRAQRPGVSHDMPPVPSFVRLPSERPQRGMQNPPHTDLPSAPEVPRGTPGTRRPNPPFLERLQTDSDLALILGLLLILWNEKADRRLMLALLYILF